MDDYKSIATLMKDKNAVAGLKRYMKEDRVVMLMHQSLTDQLGNPAKGYYWAVKIPIYHQDLLKIKISDCEKLNVPGFEDLELYALNGNGRKN
ncbi:hypothetical protein J4466_05670 [Candidatus Pacearchaeota archaeon]|nr:hypothetical protein [Candidatus Pacearchaeota archaeon]